MANIDMKVRELMKIPEAVELFERYLPGVTKHPKLKLAMGMTLRAISKHPQAKISNELVEKIDAELRALD